MTSLLIHIGYHKTGTKWLQSRVFPSPDMGFSMPIRLRQIVLNQVALAHELDYDPVAVAPRVDRALRNGYLPGTVPVLSHERLSGHPHSGGYDAATIAERLAALFGDARVLIVIREQRGALLSAYKQYVMEGGTASLRKYLVPPRAGSARRPLFDPQHFAYDRLIGRYRDLFGPDRVLVLPFEDLAGDPDGFCARIRAFARDGTAAADHPPVPADREHVSPSFAALQFKRYLNALLLRDGVHPERGSERRWVRNLVMGATRWIDRRLPGGMVALFERAARGYVHRYAGERYDESNRRTAELIGCDLGPLGYRCAASPR